MENIGKHIVEYYQSGKFLGKEANEGIVPDSIIGYENRVIETELTVKFKKKFIASEKDPIMKVYYNLQGRNKVNK